MEQPYIILPYDILSGILLESDVSSIRSFCSTSSQSNEICKYNAFWIKKFNYDDLPILTQAKSKSKWFKEYEKLVDFYHTSEHLSQAAEALFGKKSAAADDWYHKWYDNLLAEDDAATGVVRSIEYYATQQQLPQSRVNDLQQERTFFRHNQHRMTYADFRRRGLPIGSGPVEAACKSIVKNRMCRSGMRWSHEGGQKILNLRVFVKADRWDSFWENYMNLKRAA